MNWKSHKKQIITALIFAYFIIIGTVFVNDKLDRNVTDDISQSLETVPPEVHSVEQNVRESDYAALTANVTYDLNTAKIPILESDCQSIITYNNLPSLERMSDEDTLKYMNDLQVFKKIQNLGVDPKSFETPELNWKNIYNEVYDEIDKKVSYSNQVTFEGTTASQLNSLIADSEDSYITITSSELLIDESIKLKSGIGLNGAGTTFLGQGLDKAVLIENCINVTVENINLIDGGYDFGIYVINSSDFTINGCIFNHANMAGLVVIGENKNFIITNNTMQSNARAGVFFGGNVNQGVFESNIIDSNKGTSNFGAGMVLAAMKLQDYQTPYIKFGDYYLYDMGDAPHNLVIYNNIIQWNNSSGLYSFGGYMNYVVNNMLYRNDKEGMCLDFGSFGVYVSNNTVKENGGRYRQSDLNLEEDFISSYGRLPDGSSPAKLPGISFDNTAYNILVKNTIDENYGDGVKVVRSAYRNIIMNNVIGDNNIGQSDVFHFFGIDIGFASKPDQPVKGLDFTASYENIICRNVIMGNNYAGIQLADGSYCNDVYDNVITQSTNSSIECHSVLFNSIINNNVDKDIINAYVK